MDIRAILSDYTKLYYFNEDWYNKAMTENDTISIVNIGTDYAKAEMFEHAVVCWEYIANKGEGNADVFCNLGVSYYYGNGVKQDLKKAVSYYQRAAAMGHPFGMYNLAVACEYGNGTPKNLNKAIDFYRKAAEKGVNMAIDALIRLGLYDEIGGLAFYPRNLNDDSFSGEHK